MSFFCSGCFDEYDNTVPPDPNHFSNVKHILLSPEKNRTAQIIERGNSSGSSTQVVIEFGWPDVSGGGGTFVASGINLDIKLKWIDNDHLLIIHKKGLKIYPGPNDKEVRLFKEKVLISYQLIE